MADKNQILEALSNVGAGATVAPETQASPFSTKLADGTLIEGTDAADFATKVAAHVTAAAPKAPPAPMPRPQPQPQPQAPATQPFVPKPVTPNSWAEQVIVDPVAANNSLLSVALGVEDPAAYIKGIDSKIAVLEQNLTVSTVERFKEQNPDFDLDKNGSVLGQIMNERNLGLSVEALNWAKSEAENRGYFPAPVVTPPVETPVPAVVETPAVLPTSGGSSAETGPGETHQDRLSAALDDPTIPFEQVAEAAKAGGFFLPGSAALLEG